MLGPLLAAALRGIGPNVNSSIEGHGCVSGCAYVGSCVWHAQGGVQGDSAECVHLHGCPAMSDSCAQFGYAYAWCLYRVGYKLH